MILRAVKDKRWTAINNTVLNDERLSWRARGIAAYLLTKPDDWRIDHTHLWHAGIEGRDAVLKAMKELETCGYLKRVRYQRPDGKFTTEVRLFETPQQKTDFQEVPESDFQGAQKTDFQEPTTDIQDSVNFTDFQEPNTENQKSVNQKSVFQDSLQILIPNTETNMVGGDLTNQPESALCRNDPASHALATALLVKVGIAMARARQLADGYAFSEIRKQVAGWQEDYQRGKVDGLGALISRIESGWRCPDELSAEFKRTDLYLDFRTAEEIAKDEAVEAEAQRRIAEMEKQHEAAKVEPATKPAPTLAIDPTDPWAMMLRYEFPQAELVGSRLVHVGSISDSDGGQLPHYELRVVSSRHVDWVKNRLLGSIRRGLGSMLKQRVFVDVVELEAVEVEMAG